MLDTCTAIYTRRAPSSVFFRAAKLCDGGLTRLEQSTAAAPNDNSSNVPKTTAVAMPTTCIALMLVVVGEGVAVTPLDKELIGAFGVMVMVLITVLVPMAVVVIHAVLVDMGPPF